MRSPRPSIAAGAVERRRRRDPSATSPALTTVTTGVPGSPDRHDLRRPCDAPEPARSYARDIAGRLLLRLALVAATLAWAAAVFTFTIGDPGRGEQIATAVLADDDARAEIIAPITRTVVASTGIPPEQAAIVDVAVDQVLSDPAGARAYIDPFAGSWARLSGEDDPRPEAFDLTPIVDELDAQLAEAGVDADVESVLAANRIEVPDVPLLRTQLGWMDGARRGIAVAVLPLALVAVGLAAAALVVGDRRRTLRRLGTWCVLAGGTMVVIPPVLEWTARSWVSDFDAVAAATIDAATTDLRLPALVLLIAGGGLTAASFLVRGLDRRSTGARPRRTVPAGAGPQRTPTAEYPRAGGTPPSSEPITAPIPVTDAPDRRPGPAAGEQATAGRDGDDRSVWDFYR